MSHKEHCNDNHVLLQTALLLGDCFDLDSQVVLQRFMDEMAKPPWRSPQRETLTLAHVRSALSVLFNQHLLEQGETGNVFVVPTWVRDWVRVFRLEIDGTAMLFGAPVTDAEWHAFKSCLGVFSRDMTLLAGEIRGHFKELQDVYTEPQRLADLTRAAILMGMMPQFPSQPLPFAVYQQAAVLAARQELLRLAELEEKLEARARDPEVLTRLRSHIESLRSILRNPALADALTTPTPRVSDFTNLGHLTAAAAKRNVDEKFGILLAPAQFADDYRQAAEKAFSRGRSIAVGFVDIDDFKVLNEARSETWVDREVLPYFMRALEGFCYGRALAYRQGGDEYLILVHNANELEADAFFRGLQTELTLVPYPEVTPQVPTVSIGIHIVCGDAEVTSFDAKRLANEAKKEAKTKNRPAKSGIHFSHHPAPSKDTE